MRGSLKPEWLKKEPHNDIEAHFQRHDRFLVIDCVCKKEKAALMAIAAKCPTNVVGLLVCRLLIPLSENVLTREEASKRWDELDAMGTMMIQGFYGFTMGAEEPQFVGGCHCCGCCCTILQGGRMGNLTETVERSNYRVVKDYDKCTNCGECIRRCQFFAHTWKETKGGRMSVYNRNKCVGCGSCGMGCPSGALHLEPGFGGGMGPGSIQFHWMGRGKNQKYGNGEVGRIADCGFRFRNEIKIRNPKSEIRNHNR